MTTSKVAIVHERFTELGGSERVVAQLHALWPDAAVFAPIADQKAMPDELADVAVRTTFARHLYRGGTSYAALLPLLPLAMASMPLRPYDLVVTSHHAFAHHVRPAPGAAWVSYVHTPARWMWDDELRDQETDGAMSKLILSSLSAVLRRPDRRAAQRPDVLVVNSSYVAERVRAWWGRPSVVVPPPIDVHHFTTAPVEREDFFLLAGRLVPYKRPEVALAAARRAGVRLVVAGGGRSIDRLRADAGPDATFLGPVSNDQLRDLFQRCRALIFPGREDFGMVPVEAQACGAPVIARRVGGVLDSVVEGHTGVLYDGPDDVEALTAALRSFDVAQFDPVAIRRHAETFSPEVFRRRVKEVADHVLASGPAPALPTLSA